MITTLLIKWNVKIEWLNKIIVSKVNNVDWSEFDIVTKNLLQTL